MSTRTSMLALAAIAALATGVLISTDASAKGGFGHGGGPGGGHGGGFHAHAFHGGFHARVGFRGSFHAWDRNRVFFHSHYAWFHRGCFGCHAWGPGYRVGWNYRVGVPAPAPLAAAPTGGCLTKRELPNGSALFRDLCTGEQAESAPK